MPNFIYSDDSRWPDGMDVHCDDCPHYRGECRDTALSCPRILSGTPDYAKATANEIMRYSRENLIGWLKWNDPNGEYDDESYLRDGHDPLDTGELLTAAIHQFRRNEERAIPRPVLYTTYDIKDLAKEWLECLQTRYSCEFDIPTEIVLRKAGYYTPAKGRDFESPFFLVKDTIVTREELGSSLTANHIRLYEVYEDHGDDGHTSYELTGYAFIDDATMRQAEAQMMEEYPYRQIYGTPGIVNDIIRGY